MSYENPWLYNGEVFESDHIQDHFGFVYHIHCIPTGRSYIGRKYFWSFRKKKGASRRSKSESDWKKYYGSCPELKEDVKKYGKEIFNREILSLHSAKSECNYEETKQLFLNNVLKESLDDGTPAYYNSNILGRYMRKNYGNFN
jgi:hypothetical protein